jgi:release factor glutamine methyltransferase
VDSDGDRSPPGYTPTIPADQVERIRQWHENAYATALAEGAVTRTFTYLGRRFEVPPEVHPITGMSHLLGEAVLREVRADDRVLDMGTGCGVNAILAASRSADVLAVDINPRAVEAARRNVFRNDVAGRVTVRSSDVFSDVYGEFDLIIFDPPFRWFTPRSLLEAASTDEGYRAMTRFFRAVRHFLTGRGRMLIFFGTSGDLGYLRRLIADEGFASEVVAQQDLVRNGVRVDYFTFRLTVEQDEGRG